MTRKERIWTWSKAAAAVGIISVIAGAAGAGASGFFRLGTDRQSVESKLANQAGRDDAQDGRLDDHEQRIRANEQNAVETRTDVRWIRQYLEERRP